MGRTDFKSRADRSHSSDDLEESWDDVEKSSNDVLDSLAVVPLLSHDRLGLPADVEKSLFVRSCYLADGFRG